MIVLERRQRETGRDFALRCLQQNIIDLELKPGAAISENELATILGLSRTPVREALMELSKVDIINVYPQKGSAVALIDDEQVEEALFMRNILEGAIVKYCCENATQEDIDRLKDHVHLQQYYLERNYPMHKNLNMDNEFHAILFHIAGKMRIFKVMRSMSLHLDRIRTLTLGSFPRESVVEEHNKIVKAIEERNVEKAVDLMTYHTSRFHFINDDLHNQYASYYKK